MMQPFKLSLYFSYGQFSVYDPVAGPLGLAWTKAHSDQGFVRTQSAVAFGTLLEFGDGDVAVYPHGIHSMVGYDRVIAVPFVCSSGRITVVGPEEFNVERNIDIARGYYMMTCAQQTLVDDELAMLFKERIDLFFESLSYLPKRSRLLVADRELNPPLELLECPLSE